MPAFRILGPLEIVDSDGQPLALAGQRQRALLALLLIRANHVVATDFLIDSLWGERPPRTAPAALQNSVAAIRKVLGPDVLLTRPPGYQLVVPPEALDLTQFEAAVAEARTLDADERADRLRAALSLWRGEPLAEFAFDDFAETEIRRLEELRLTTIEDRVDADLAVGRAAELVPELVALVAQNPLRERLVGQLMLAHYHSARQDDALRVYHDARRALDDRGLQPSPQLQELYGRILRHEVPRPRLAEPDADEAHFEEVVAALLGARLVPVIGGDTGLLGEELATRFGYQEQTRDLARVAQFVALTKGSGPLHDELRDLLAQTAAPTVLHRVFAALPALLRGRGLAHQLLVTTSYDLSLEQALLDAHEEFDVVAYIATGRERGRFCHRAPNGSTTVIDVPNTYATELSLARRTVVLKLHGGLAPDDVVVVTEDDFIAYLARGDVASAIPVALAAKLRRSHFLFLGYGMREWSLRLVLDRMWGGETPSYRSWSVVPEAQPLERQFWRARDVDLLELPLPDYGAALARYVGIEAEVAA